MPHGLPDHAPVIIIGAGPAGLSMALGLARHGVRSVVLEKKTQTSRRSKAPGIHVRTREVFRQWGVEDRFLQAGELLEALTLHSAAHRGRRLGRLDFNELEPETERPGLLVLEQAHTEKLLLEAVRETGLSEVQFGAEAVELDQDSEPPGVVYRQSGAVHRRGAPFIIGCDGVGSFVRKALGLSFEGFTYAVRPMLADVRISDMRDRLDWPRIHNGRGGITGALRLDEELWRIIRLERGDPEGGDDVPPDEIGKRVAEVLGEGSYEVEWANRFRIHLRAAHRFRVGRILLAGDAAHVHSPAGGLGMNAGIQDAHNLAWKLATALRGGDTDRLLDSYETERRTVVIEKVSRYSDVATRILLQSPVMVRGAAAAFLGLALTIPPVRRVILRRATMIGLRYKASPLLAPSDRAAGLRLPNPCLRAPDGSRIRLYDLIGAGPALIEVSEKGGPAVQLPVDRVIRIGRGGHQEALGLLRRLLGGCDGWILVRPDLHVAWARTSPMGLADAARKALGMPS